jgi:hypothetical protein
MMLALLASVADAAPPTTIATSGSKAGQVELPRGVAVDQESGDIYVADRNNFRIDKFDSDGQFLLAWGFGVADGGVGLQSCGPAATPPTMKCFKGAAANTAKIPGAITPEAVTVAPSTGDVYVADSSNHRVTEFTPTGDFILMFGKNVNTTPGTSTPNLCTKSDLESGAICGQGAADSSAGAFFSGPTNVLAGESGDIWVGDTARLLEFTSDGEYVSQAAIAGGGATKALGIDPASGDFYIKSASLPGVRRYEPSGVPFNALTEVGAPLDPAGQPEALVVAADGTVYVGDKTSPYRFLAFDAAGDQVSQFGAGQVIGVPGSSGANPLAVSRDGDSVFVTSGQSGGNSRVQRFPLPEPGPLPEGPRTEGLLPTTATLVATLNPEGRETEYHFEYSTDGSFSERTSTRTLPTPPALPGFDPETVDAGVANLVPDTQYRFRLSASNHCDPAQPSEVCTVTSEEGTFHTPPAVRIDAQWAVEIGSTSATLKGELNPLGVPAEWWVQYGPTLSYGSATKPMPLGDSLGDIAVRASLASLEPGTLYHYQFLARDIRDGIVYIAAGPDHTLITGSSAGAGVTLPDSRTWERVTPAGKGGSAVVAPTLGGVQAAVDGNGLAFSTLGASTGAEGGRIPEPSESLARRIGGVWVATDISPAQETSSPAAVGNQFRLFSSDLSRALVEPRGQRVRQPTLLSDEASERTPYLRENLADPVRWRPVVTGKPGFANVPTGTVFGGDPEGQLLAFQSPVRVVGGTPDLDHVIVQSRTPLSAEAGNVPGTLYEWSDGRLQLVSLLPDSEGGGASEAMLGYGSTAIHGGSTIHAISDDGRFVYWGNKEESRPSALYLRDVVAGQTIRLDVRQPGALGTGPAAPIFQAASADGRLAFFTDTQQLTADAGETGSDLYVCELIQAPGGEECSLRDLTPETDGTSSEVQGISAVADDGDYVYFVANGALAPGAEVGDCAETSAGSGQLIPGTSCNLYVAHLNDSSWSTRLIGGLSSADWRDWSRAQGLTGEVVASASPSGRYLGFMSDRSLTGYDNHDAASGEADEEVFRYDAAADNLVCVSCNPSGARPQGALIDPDLASPPADWGSGAFEGPLWGGRWLGANLPDPQTPEVGSSYTYKPHSVLDDGRVLFNAFDPLVPADSNRTSDVYIYEPHGDGSCTPSSASPGIVQAAGGGCVALLSSGTSSEESGLLDATPSGSDVFFMTSARLSVLDEDNEYDIYDARVDGVVARQEPRTQCLGEACQPTVSSPSPGVLGSSSFQGPGNVHEKRANRRCPKGKRRVRHKGKVRCVAKHHRRRHGKHRRHNGHRAKAHRVKKAVR